MCLALNSRRGLPGQFPQAPARGCGGPCWHGQGGFWLGLCTRQTHAAEGNLGLTDLGSGGQRV